MLTSEAIRDLLVSNFPDQTIILGESKTRRLANAVASEADPKVIFRQAQGGSNLDPLSSLQILIAAATLIKLCLDVWEKFDRAGKKPTQDEYLKEVVVRQRAQTVAQSLEQGLKLVKDTYQVLSKQ